MSGDSKVILFPTAGQSRTSGSSTDLQKMLLRQLPRLLKQELIWSAVSDYKNLIAAVDRGLTYRG